MRGCLPLLLPLKFDLICLDELFILFYELLEEFEIGRLYWLEEFGPLLDELI